MYEQLTIRRTVFGWGLSFTLRFPSLIPCEGCNLFILQLLQMGCNVYNPILQYGFLGGMQACSLAAHDCRKQLV